MTTRIIRAKTTPAYPPQTPSRNVSVLTTAGSRSGSNVIHGGGGAGATVQIGFTWTGYRPAMPAMASTLAILPVQSQHIIGFGAENGIELNPAPGVYNWGAFEPAFNEMMSCNPAKPIIIFCRAPGWMKSTGITQDDAPVLPAFFGQYAELCKQVALRYTNVNYFSVWNEMKGFYNNTLNRWDYEGYTGMYNAIWSAVKGVRPSCKIGGPYVILQSGCQGTSWSHGPTTGLLAFPGGSHDLRQVQVMQYFRDNALGCDFISCDGGIENQFPRDPDTGAGLPAFQIQVDPYQQIEKLWGWWRWCRTLGGFCATVEFINFETYVNQVGPILGWNETQKEDLMIDVARKSQNNLTPNIGAYLPWGSPGYRPQVINAVNDFVWANTPSNYGPKVANWHATGV